MNEYLVLLASVAGLTFVTSWLLVRHVLNMQSQQLYKERLKERVGLANQFAVEERQQKRCWWCLMGRALGSKNIKELKKIQQALMSAGFRAEHHLGAYYFIKATVIVASLLFMLGLWSLFAIRLEWVILVAVVVMLLPERILFYLGKRRLEKVSEFLPDFLDMCNICMNAGLSYLVAFRRVVDELKEEHPEICYEFDYLLEQIRMGMPRVEALKQFAQRNPTKEIQSLVQVLIQNEKLGSSISEAINDFSRRMYKDREQYLQEKAAKTSAKMAIVILPFLMLPYIILLVGERMTLLGRGF